jgi:hypothetical protein
MRSLTKIIYYFIILSVCFTGNMFIYAEGSGIPFPRLGMWWLDAEEEPSDKIGRYDILLNEFEFENGKNKIEEIRKYNKSILIFRPISPTEVNWYIDDKINPFIQYLPSSFFLLRTGSILSKPLNKNTNIIFVDKIKDISGNVLFHKGNTVSIGNNESAVILQVNISNKSLKVKRGFLRNASDHNAGDHIAEHVTFWPDTWVMNNTINCRKDLLYGFKDKKNWLEFYFTLITMKAHPMLEENIYYIDQENLKYDGIIIDRFEDHESWLDINSEDPQFCYLDLKHDNNTSTKKEFDESWMEGTDILLSLLRKYYKGIVIIRNNSLSTRFDIYDGQVYETSGWTKPSFSWWEQLFINNGTEYFYKTGSYLEWFNNKNKPLYVMIEVYEDEEMPQGKSYNDPFKKPGFKPNYRRMRFSLTSTLLGNGYYSYEANTSTHGTGGLLWFDEYDNAGEGKGYLGYPQSGCIKLESGIYKREFTGGIVLVNPQSEKLSVNLEKKYQKIKGKQEKYLNDGSIVDSVTINGYDGIILLNIK